MGTLTCKCDDITKEDVVMWTNPNTMQENTKFIDYLNENIQLKKELQDLKIQLAEKEESCRVSNIGSEKKEEKDSISSKELIENETITPCKSKISMKGYGKGMKVNDQLETINERVSNECHTDNECKGKAEETENRNVNKTEESTLKRCYSIDQLERVSNSNKKNNPTTKSCTSDRCESSLINTSIDRLKASNIKDLILPMNSKNSKVSGALYINEKELLINESNLYSLNEDSVIYDLEMSKIKFCSNSNSNTNNEVKLSLRYCQVTKKYFKYFKSLYSSSVWQDKPLMRLPLKNIEKIVIGKNTIQKLKLGFNIKIIIQIFVQFDAGFPFDKKYELIYSQSPTGVDYILEFGITDEQQGIGLVKALAFLKRNGSSRPWK